MSMFFTPQHNKAQQIRVLELSLIPSGTYNQQFSRPYTMDLGPDLLNKITGVVEQATQYGQSITPMAIATLGTAVVTPTPTHQGGVPIVNGWDTQRLRFRLIVEVTYSVGGARRFYYTGYTDHLGVSTMNNYLDQDMVFYINSIISSRVIQSNTPMGVVNTLNIERGKHLLCDNNWQGALESNQTYLLRPEDIYNNMATEHVRAHANNMLDTRNMVQRNVLESNIANGLPNNYVSNVIDGFVKATLQSTLSSQENDIFADARRHVNGAPDPNPLVTAITQLRGFSTMSNTFTLKDLRDVDPMAPQPGFYEPTLSDQAHMSRTGSTAEWHGSDGLTVSAVSLSQSIPAIMSAVGLQSLSFASTNDTIGCIVDTRVSNAASLDQLDKERRALMFKTRFDSEVVPVISYNNMLRYFISGDVDLFGDARISIGINGDAIYEYTMPIFAGNLVAPVVSRNAEHTNRIISDFGMVLDHVRDNTSNSIGVNSPSLFTPNLV